MEEDPFSYVINSSRAFVGEIELFANLIDQVKSYLKQVANVDHKRIRVRANIDPTPIAFHQLQAPNAVLAHDGEEIAVGVGNQPKDLRGERAWRVSVQPKVAAPLGAILPKVGDVGPQVHGQDLGNLFRQTSCHCSEDLHCRPMTKEKVYGYN